MKKLTFSATFTAVVLLAFVGLTSFGAAEHKRGSAAQEDQGKLLQIVREATQQYQGINAIAVGYVAFLVCVSASEDGAMAVHSENGIWSMEPLTRANNKL